ncbi:structural maintenance of chromosomes protein 6 isoform X2 [Diabrotica virgifera virgifera]|uniref:Structural maintenance of chromosomes protein 6 n=1 Tax=Diabrotica virgifera virgifera TaxID=50390 RepID=A0ABM5L5B7_DIAVI|nr:structural maintenance of chromosomes protein 6 isoform X2 [Diabrotica virgifera virgifera]
MEDDPTSKKVKVQQLKILTVNLTRMSSRKRKPFSQLSGDETQNAVATKKSKVAERTCERRAGTINCMILKNFMCHSHLEVKFENIIFVTGRNGSGKSAILTALVLGLGGRATLTNRGSSAKGFVKAGKPSASIEIEICNEGPMAYRQSVYGDAIHVIRTLNANGGGSYKVRSANGEIISTQASEVHNITINLNIQVDNPICILNQDTSRNFLSSSNPKNKYTLFVKATKLETLEIEYKKIQTNKKESERVMREKTEAFRKLQEEIKSLKRKIENHKSILSLKDQKELLHRELMWAKVRDIEDELENLQKNVDALNEKLANFQNTSEKRLAELNSFTKNIQGKETEKKELEAQLNILKEPLNDIQSKIDDMQRDLSAKKRSKHQISTSIQNKNSDIASLEKDIAASKENMSKVEKRKMERIKTLDGLQTKLKGMDDHLETAKNDLFQIRGDLSHKENEETAIKEEIREIDRNMNNEKENLNALSSESGNTLLLYGRDMPGIKKMIQQNIRNFRQEPRGPLGSYIKIKDKRWTVAVEGHLTPSLLGAFVVDNKEDNQRLREIFNRVLGKSNHPQIITSKFISKKHNVSAHLVVEPSDCKSLYNAIEIDDPVVSNAIVDNSSPENILLIPSDTRAQELLSDRRNVPRNCNQGVTIKGDKYYPDPNYKSYASSYHRAKFLQVDTKEATQQLQQNIKQLENKFAAKVQELQEHRATMRERMLRRNELEKKVKDVNTARAQIRRQLEELNSSVEPEVQNVQFLEQEMDECRRTINQKQAELERINEEIRAVKQNINEEGNRTSDLTKSVKQLEARIRSVNDEIREIRSKQKDMSTNGEFDKKRIKDYESRIESAMPDIRQKQNDLEKCTGEALAIGDRLEELRRVQAIAKEINDVKNKISSIESEAENLTDVVDKHNTLSDKYKKSVAIMESLNDDLNELSRAVDRRKKHYKLTEAYFVTFMKCSFEKILKHRQFKGTLEINIAEKKLDLIVIPQHGSQGQTTTANLSGGERSFSMVAFLYALWQCMELPFYILDEFDVYMDKLNRIKVIDILLHHAKSKTQLQFVFLTPQDVSFVNQEVPILRLEDPERFDSQN